MLGLVVTILVSAALINGGDNGADEFIAKQAWLYGLDSGRGLLHLPRAREVGQLRARLRLQPG